MSNGPANNQGGSHVNFDVVNNGRLMVKLLDLKFATSTLLMIESYLTNRRCCTLANGKRSNNKDILYGVPQGSILGPVLFTLYVNDLPEVVKNCLSVLYADDLILVSSAKTPEAALTKLQLDLNKVIDWCDVNRLTPNVDKTKFMWFTSHQKLDNTLDQPVLVKGTSLGEVEDYKYLGIWLDSTLSFKRQLENTCNKTSAKLTQFKLYEYTGRHRIKQR